MRGSSVTTFLMFLPLIAIPLLAIFGVPEFSAVNASSPTDLPAPGTSIADFNGSPQSSVNGANGLFEPVTPKTNPSAPLPDMKADPFKALPGNKSSANGRCRRAIRTRLPRRCLKPDRRNGNDPRPLPPIRPPCHGAVRGSDCSSWASRTLSCSRARPPTSSISAACTHTPTTPVTRRFEAENRDPLRAVADVLRQIEARR